MIATCAGMNIPASEAGWMSLWEYEATLCNWNKQHDPDGDLDPVTAEDWTSQLSFLEANPQFLN